MSVLTAARSLTGTADYSHLTDQQRADFTTAMEAATNAANNTEYRLAHQVAALTIGMRLPDSGEIARCTCPTCYCDQIFDANDARTYTEGPGNEIVQCPACADDHRYGDQ